MVALICMWMNWVWKPRLPLPEPPVDKPYLLGFPGRAYSGNSGDVHNLFGDTNSVDVVMTADGGYELKNPIRREIKVDDVLRYV